MDCIFCKITDGTIPSKKIWEDDQFLAFLDINPITSGHTLLIPKKHIDNIFDLDAATYSGLFDTAKKISNTITKAMHAKRMGMMVEGFLVPHAHLHLIPLKKASEFSSARAKHVSSEELDFVVEKIRNELK